MHGMIFVELKRFVVATLGSPAWNQIAARAGVGSRLLLPSETYPDEELVRLIEAASQLSGKPAAELVHAFGVALAPVLLTKYIAWVSPSWRTIDLLMQTESTMHRMVRMKAPGASPPELTIERIAPDEVRIRYGSQRKLCALARGLVQGLADHYGETVTISETSCMLRGGASCDISVRVDAPTRDRRAS
ncbi:MAG: heme NO-binding domain-containing protein [Polyangiaceae bacterium]|nr:heme NO-binding domain-containing protein [Polyangiaceae bacterium]